MSTRETETQILKDHLATLIASLEKGESCSVSGGYITHEYKSNLIDKNCGKIVSKLVSLGYEYTTNHGFGCKDYRFTKKIEL
jgi:hypothetical protein